MTAAPKLNLIATPVKNGLAEGQDAVVDALIRLQAPDAPTGAPERPPLDLSLVIDRSGSMQGPPLAEAKRCAEMIVDHLTPQDRVAIVDFGSDVRITHGSALVADREVVKSAIRGVTCDGMTALHGGWLKGAELIADRAGQGGIARVLLLSDGCANVGLAKSAEIAPQAEKLREAGVSTSTYGLGAQFDEELMTALATAAGGRAYYGKTADDLMDPFREEFDLLAALCAREVRLRLTPAAGVIVEVLNDYPRDGAAWRLPDLAYGGEVWAIARASVAAQHIGAVDGVPLFDVDASARHLEDRAITIDGTALTLAARSPDAYDALPEDALVATRLQEIEAARLQREARAAAERGDWDAVERSLRSAESVAADNQYVKASLSVLRGFARRKDARRFSKEAHFKAHKMATRMAARDEAAFDASAQELGSASYLRRYVEEGSQARTIDAEDAANAFERVEQTARDAQSRGARARDRDAG